jgi:hypothetical protein
MKMGTNRWDYRWVDNLGNILYTDNEDYDPNIDIELQMDGWKKSKVKNEFLHKSSILEPS